MVPFFHGKGFYGFELSWCVGLGPELDYHLASAISFFFGITEEIAVLGQLDSRGSPHRCNYSFERSIPALSVQLDYWFLEQP